jgi:hypothetical protein
VFSTKIVNHGGRQGNAMRALARWRHPVALSEALDVIHRAICPASYRRIRMANEIASNLPAFFVIANSLLPTTIAK